ncbi:acetyl-CoA carboxylase biotin carboxylase subunit family protein [Streptomyces sp. NPDC059688]|uniref:ATP-grasp domain-containing protein n=1 Tax=Streptomyces sp. NPDC059688 TaxID=3346906 RepID=UPI0036A176CB
MKSVLILSKWNAGGVGPTARWLRARGLRPVLISDVPDDVNRDKCDDHVLVDFDRESMSNLATRLNGRGIAPIAVVNLIEMLMPWQIAIAVHYGLPGGDVNRSVLVNKTLVRERMQALGLSNIRFSSDPAQVDFFPAIVKPSCESSNSRLVRRVDGPAELLAYQHHLSELGFADAELIIEEYLPGTEFEVDGPVVAGRFHPVLAAEKSDHDDIRHHDAGINLHPPQRDHVRKGVHILSEAISALCADLGLDQLWLDVEGRTTEDGRTELVEINPRPGRGMYFPSIWEPCGIDPFEAHISMALGEYTFTQEGLDPVRDQPITGKVFVEGDELGTVEVSTSEDDLLELPGVMDVQIINGHRISSLEQENMFLGFTVTADSVGQLRARVATVLSTLDYRITAQ